MDEMFIAGASYATSSQIRCHVGNDIHVFDVEEELGTGAFGTVVRAIDNRGKSYAIKKINCHNVQTYDLIVRELQILLKLKHPSIVRMIAFDFEGTSAILVMEYCQNGTLNERLDKFVEEPQKFLWMTQLSAALQYLHSCNIVHRDLKPDNVLIDSGDDAKLADFGIARNFRCGYGGIDTEQNPDVYLSEYLESYMGTFAGTPYWVAPEVFDHKYTEKADIFSLGVIFYAIMLQESCVYDGNRYYGAFVLYKGQEVGIGLAMYEQGSSVYPPLPSNENYDKAVMQIIHKMLCYNANERLSLDVIQIEISDAYVEYSNKKTTVDTLLSSVNTTLTRSYESISSAASWIYTKCSCKIRNDDEDEDEIHYEYK